MFVHAVFLSLKEEATAAEMDAIFAMLANLAPSALAHGATHWSVSENHDTRRKQLIGNRRVDIVVMGTFPDCKSFIAWRDSEEHKRVAGGLGGMPVDWLVGDVEPVNQIHS